MIRATHRVFRGAAFGLAVLLSTAAQGALTHEWTFEEPDGTAAPEVKDSVGAQNGNFGGVLGDSNRSADVPAGIGSTRSLNFNTGPAFTANTSGNWVDVFSPTASYLVMSNTADWTVSLWYKGTDAGSDDSVNTHVIVGSGATFADLEMYTGGKVVWTHYNGGYQYNVISSVSVNDGLAWHNIVLVHHSNQTADLYVDAVAQVTGANAFVQNNSFPYKIGGFMTGPDTPDNFTSGLLDDVRVYDNSLTQADVNALNNISTPEPASLGVLAVGASLLLGRRRRA